MRARSSAAMARVLTHQSCLMYLATVPTTAGRAPSIEFLQLTADPLRCNLLEELGRSDRRVGELCGLLGKPQSLVSYHLRALRNGGLVSARQSTADGRDTYYRADIDRFATFSAVRERHCIPPFAWRVSVQIHRGDEVERPTCCSSAPATRRSQMAEALLAHRTQGAVTARSAGSHPKPLHANAIRTMAER